MIIIEIFLRFIQKIGIKFIGTKNYYMNAPDDVISYKQKIYLFRIGHLLPSAFLSIFIPVKIMPFMFVDYEIALENNSPIILYTVLFLFIPVSILNGILIEKILISTNKPYKDFVS